VRGKKVKKSNQRLKYGTDTEVEPKFIPLWPDAGQQAGLGRNSTYKAADRGDIPTVRFGGRRMVPVAKWKEITGEA
jgi:hypothetical protein